MYCANLWIIDSGALGSPAVVVPEASGAGTGTAAAALACLPLS